MNYGNASGYMPGQEKLRGLEPKKPKGGLFGGGGGAKDFIGMALGALGDGLSSWSGGQAMFAPMMAQQYMSRQEAEREEQQRQAQMQAAQMEEQRRRAAASGIGYTPQQTEAMLAGVPLPNAPEPDAFERALRGAGIDPTTPEAQDLFRRRAESMARDPNDEFVVVPLPGLGTYAGPRSGMADVLGSRGAQGGNPPSTLPPDFFDERPAAQAAQPLTGQRTITRAEYNRMLQGFGGNQRAMNEWMRNNNVIAGN